MYNHIENSLSLLAIGAFRTGRMLELIRAVTLTAAGGSDDFPLELEALVYFWKKGHMSKTIIVSNDSFTYESRGFRMESPGQAEYS
jgi:hypothetical protein